jgi:hypothetical protein
MHWQIDAYIPAPFELASCVANAHSHCVKVTLSAKWFDGVQTGCASLVSACKLTG